jgi:glycosyltransferase involved in cell wall biosynthesis
MIVGMMRVKNEARWICEVIYAAHQACEHIFILDDHSTDDTERICRSFDRVTVFTSPFQGLDEQRDKDWLLSRVREGCDVLAPHSEARWVLAIDGDEVLQKPKELEAATEAKFIDCWSLQVLYLWNSRNQVRTDGVYGRFWRPSLFRLKAGLSFRTTENGGNFHCGNVPEQFSSSGHSNAKLLHYGYMHAEDRRRKFYWYNQIDPSNVREDGYRHMIQGDPGGPPTQAKLAHAGPLTLAAI